jgi:hypothetical protein
MDDFSLEAVRGEGAASDARLVHRENIAFLVDCKGGILRRTPYRGSVASLRGLTMFQAAVKQVSDLVASRLEMGVEDDVVIIFFNPGTHVWHAAGAPSLDLLQRLSDLLASSPFVDETTKDEIFLLSTQDEISEKTIDQQTALRDALVAAVLEFQVEEVGAKRYRGDDRGKERPLTVACWTMVNLTETLEDNDETLGTIFELQRRRHIEIHTVLLDKQDAEVNGWVRSNSGSLWSKLSNASRSSADVPISNSVVSHCQIPRMAQFRGTPRHASFSVPWRMGSYCCVNMRFTSLTTSAWPRCMGSSKWVDASDSSWLMPKCVPEVAEGLQATDGMESDDDPSRQPYYPKLVGKKCSSVAPVVLSEDIVSSLRFPVPTKCIFLIGFKPRTWLDVSWQIRDAYFIHPESDATTEQKQHCRALHDTMAERDILAVCGFIKAELAEPRLAAVIPYFSRDDGSPWGFSLMELPFSDDIRHPENSVDLKKVPELPPSGVHSAEKLIDSHRVKCSEYPGVAVNPHIRRHFDVIRAVLLDKESLYEAPPQSRTEHNEGRRPDVLTFAKEHYLC